MTLKTCLRWPLLPAGVLTLLAGLAQAHPLYDTTRVVTQQGNACVGSSHCAVIALQPRRIGVGRGQNITGRCPVARPYLVSWDATYHEHIGLKVVRRSSSGLRIRASNLADKAGKATVYIGCATKRSGPTVQVQSLGALPSKAPAIARP